MIDYSSFFPDLSSDSDTCDGENSDDGLKIVIESPKSKKKSRKAIEINPAEKEIIETVEKDLEETLDEKAAKANLTSYNVKHILKHVVTNEHVVALVRQAEDPQACSESLAAFEPKLTRAKAKELLSTQPVASLPWVASTVTQKKVSSKVSVLVSEELQDDSSGDEYVPAEEESEDDRESSFLSENLSEPPTPVENGENCSKINWTEDGVFKIPFEKDKEATNEEEDANIALRTRSKLSLSSTPLEVIEEAFIPPDITTDMYDMDCDDDDWKEFLKKFTRPLEEVTKEDDDHDPEYNILADEEIEDVDKEELREDKAVKVSRKEVNKLIAELFEYTDSYKSNLSQNKVNLDSEPQITILQSEKDHQQSSIGAQVDMTKTERNDEMAVVKEEKLPEEYVTIEQALLIEQQMRQHIQMLTQNFLLTYQHPELHNMALTCREYLVNLKLLGDPYEYSVFKAHNLTSALNLIEYWEKMFINGDEEAEKTVKHMVKVLCETKARRLAGLPYIPTFPPLVLKTISESDVFLYPTLLPRIPFKPSEVFVAKSTFTKSEEELIALALEQFIPYLSEGTMYKTSKGEVQIKYVANFIQKYSLPSKDSKRIYRHIIVNKQPRCPSNPIKYYFENKKAPFTQHLYVALHVLGTVPPKDRKRDMLPAQWQDYIYNQYKRQEVLTPVFLTPVKVPVPVLESSSVRLVNFTKSSKKRRILPKPTPPTSTFQSKHKFTNLRKRNLFPPRSAPRQSVPKRKLESHFKSPIVIRKQLAINAVKYLKDFKFNSTIFGKMKESGCEKSETKEKMVLPSLPGKEKLKVCSDDRGVAVVAEDDEDTVEKDNPEDINALMIASSTMKSVCRKNLSGAEKKKAKLRREFTQNLAMLAPEDPSIAEEKANIYAQAYYDKLREHLDVDDYHKIMEIFNSHEYPETNVNLFKKIEPILHPKYPELLNEFLEFLTPAEAKTVGKLAQHVIMNNMSTFLRKLEIYFKDQPTQVKKIYRTLTEMAGCKDVTMDKVKSAMLPLLKGNKLLSDWFLQIFLNERPPESLLNGTWEELDMDTVTEENCAYETITVPDLEDPYGGPTCICSCHSSEITSYKGRARHCLSCGKRFMQGRVYIHTSKGLRLANITFDASTGVDHVKRLSCPSNKQKRKPDGSPSKQLTSPPKENQEEGRLHNESEEDVLEGGKKRSKQVLKSPKKKKINKATDKNTKTEKSRNTEDKSLQKAAEEKLDDTINSVIKLYNADEDEAKSEEVVTTDEPSVTTTNENSDVRICEVKPIVEEVTEWDCNTSIESVDIKLSPEHSAESGSEFCEESSQDNINSESEDSVDESGSVTNSPAHSENSNSNTFEQTSWTRDEDKIILETFQKEDDKEKALQHICELLVNRTLSQIKARFDTLMSLLQAMTARNNKP